MNIIHKTLLTVLLAVVSIVAVAQQQKSLVLKRENAAHEFSNDIPAGNYSGIVYIGDNLYALVSDKGKGEIVFVRINIDGTTGDILSAIHEFSLPTGERNGDNEDIVYCDKTKTFYIASEEDNIAREFSIEKIAHDRQITSTGKTLGFGDLKGATYPNRGMESLAYNGNDGIFWTTTECPLRFDGDMATSENNIRQRLRLISTDKDGNTRQYAYIMDAAESSTGMKTFLVGVSAITSLGNGILFVLEREIHIPEGYLGAFSIMKVYAVDINVEKEVPASEALSDDSPFVGKRLICQWRTNLGLFDQALANYEGMCLGPKLADGSQVVVLVSDSQNQYAGVLRDWFKTFVVGYE